MYVRYMSTVCRPSAFGQKMIGKDLRSLKEGEPICFPKEAGFKCDGEHIIIHSGMISHPLPISEKDFAPEVYLDSKSLQPICPF